MMPSARARKVAICPLVTGSWGAVAGRVGFASRGYTSRCQSVEAGLMSVTGGVGKARTRNVAI